MISLLLEVPVTTDIDAMEEALQNFIRAVDGHWSWQGREVAGRRLIDCVVSEKFNWEYLLPIEERPVTFGVTPAGINIDSQVESWISSLGWRLVGVWKWDGNSQDTYDFADPANPIITKEVVVRLYPARTGDPITDSLFIDVLNYMEDVVQRDENGVELSRERPTYPKEVHSWGWPPRR